jgi:CBS domain containing-hemolysin-like protein
MNGVGNMIVRLLGFKPNAGHTAVHSVEELGMLVQGSREAGVLELTEERIARRAFDFSDIDVRQIMKPRTEVVALPLNIRLPDLLKKITRQQYSRYPVYDSSIDSVVGILHTKDLLDVVVDYPGLLNNGGASFRLKPILRSPLFVPETVSVDTLLERMQRTRTQFAVVIDEYGGMSGIATMEDVIEELVGEVQDEFDAETSPIQTHGEALVVDGLLSMTDIIERFGEPDSDFESTTIGGYVAERLDRIPQLGDEVKFSQYHLRVEEMDGMRPARLRFVLPTETSTSQA